MKNIKRQYIQKLSNAQNVKKTTIKAGMHPNYLKNSIYQHIYRKVLSDQDITHVKSKSPESFLVSNQVGSKIALKNQNSQLDMKALQVDMQVE